MRKKIISLIPILATALLFSCSMNGSDTTVSRTQKDEESIDSSSDSFDVTTELEQNEISYDEFFSSVRPYEIKSPLTTDNTPYYSNATGCEETEIAHSIKVSQLLSDTVNPFMFNGDFEENRLYIVNYKENKVEGYFCDLHVYYEDGNNTENPPFACKEEGVYVIEDKTRFLLLDYEGKTKKVYFTAEEGYIKSFYVLDSVAWILSGDSIFRIYLPTRTVDEILFGIDSNAFQYFLYPISNFEIEWMEYISGPGEDSKSERANYYNALSKQRLTKDEKKEDSELSWPAYTGWWFVPDNAKDEYEKLTFSLPDNSVKEYGFDRNISCGGGKKLYDDPLPGISAKNGGNAVGGSAICYDLIPVFENGALSSVKMLPEWVVQGSFSKVSGRNDIVVTEGTYYGDYAEGKYSYRFAFICENESSPVYCVALRSDLYSEDIFNEIIASVILKEH